MFQIRQRMILKPDGQDEPALIEEKTDNGASSESDINVSLETKAED